VRRAAIYIAAVLVLLVLPGQAAAKPRPFYWGAWIGAQLTGEEAPWDMGATSSFQARLGRGLSLLQFSAPFARCEAGRCSYNPFPTTEMAKIRAYGAIPLLSWNSAVTGDAERSRLAELGAGGHDAYIHDFAAAAAAWGHPFFLRFDWEMNGNWFPWGTGVEGNTAAEFREAWRRVHDIFVAAGATNATWVWCPYANRGESLRLRPFYPGDRYVDWTCLDAYNWGPESPQPTQWRSFRELAGPTYRRIAERIAPHKPMMIGEVASTGTPEAKAWWIHGMFASLRQRFEKVRGLVWFNKFDSDTDWPLDSGPALEAFSRELRLGAKENAYAELASSPIPPPG
jgi:hypothetical protein